MNQLGLNLAPAVSVPRPKVTPKRDSGAVLRDHGIQRAADHAEREIDGWQDMAVAAFREFARTHRSFTTEQVRLASAVPTPPEKRAWGAVARRACKEGIARKVGVVQAKSPTVHCMYVTAYESLIYLGVA